MSSLEKQTSNVAPSSPQINRSDSPSTTGVRTRAGHRLSNLGENTKQFPRRRSSFFSETISETHRSFRSSTDDILLPRARTMAHVDDLGETTHWHSIPLGLALLPAISGLFFRNGSAIVTDVTLLGLAAILLNWALRLPWEWYRSSQATIIDELDSPVPITPIEEEIDEEISLPAKMTSDRVTSPSQYPKERVIKVSIDNPKATAQRELRIHEVCALLTCFLAPVLGAWLLHGIRSQLSRPSEGLVSNYNLTIFLLVAEIRPMSHLMKLVQRRTLFLQRKVNSTMLRGQAESQQSKVSDLDRRLEELEAHVANAADARLEPQINGDSSDNVIAKASSQASSDLRRSMQPELDALNRAMRRYEKRMTISAIQVEARLQDLETKVQDVVVLAAAAQRSVDRRSQNYAMVLTNWACAIVVLPIQAIITILSLPGRLVRSVFDWISRLIRQPRPKEFQDFKSGVRQPTSRSRILLRKPKGAV